MQDKETKSPGFFAVVRSNKAGDWLSSALNLFGFESLTARSHFYIQQSQVVCI